MIRTLESIISPSPCSLVFTHITPLSLHLPLWFLHHISCAPFTYVPSSVIFGTLTPPHIPTSHAAMMACASSSPFLPLAALPHSAAVSSLPFKLCTGSMLPVS